MGQRVNIQFSIDIDELPNEIQRMLSTALTDIDKAHNTSLQKIEVDNLMTLETLSEIETIRTTLAHADFVLGDITNIISSFINYKTKSMQPPAPPTNYEHVMPETTAEAPDMNTLQQQIQQFKDNLASETPSSEVSD